MQTTVSTNYTDAEFDAKLLNALNKALQLNGLAKKENERQQAKRKILTIDGASEVTGLAKSSIYFLAPKGKIPNFKKGKRLYFFEDELLQWIVSGKRLTQPEIDMQADSKLLNKKPR